MKNPENKVTNATVINGVVLTEDVLSFLDSLQGDDNGYMKEAREEINHAISLLIDATDDERLIDERKSEIFETIKYLNIFNRSLKNLMKP